MSYLPTIVYGLQSVVAGLLIIDNAKRGNTQAVGGWLVALLLSMTLMSKHTGAA